MQFPGPEQLRVSPLFRGLSDSQLQSIVDGSRVREHARGHTLFLQGDPANFFFMVIHGWVSVYRDTADGEHTVIHVIRAGETFAEPAALNLGVYPASAEAATDCMLLDVPAARFKDLLIQDPGVAMLVIGQLSQRLRFMVSELERLQVQSASQRLGSFLLELAPPDGTCAVVELPFDKTLIAARLGMKPESLSRALAKLRGLGVQANRGHRVELNNLPALRAHCISEMA